VLGAEGGGEELWEADDFLPVNTTVDKTTTASDEDEEAEEEEEAVGGM
jgi:hypothetical protein